MHRAIEEDAVLENPYETPRVSNIESSPRDTRRWVFLLAPAAIPLIVHSVVRCFIPRDETIYHGMFLLGSLFIGFAWAVSLADRCSLSFWKNYLLSCLVCGGVVLSASLAPSVVNIVVRLIAVET